MLEGHGPSNDVCVCSGFKNLGDADSFDTDGISLFHVKGNTKLSTRAIQVGAARSMRAC